MKLPHMSILMGLNNSEILPIQTITPTQTDLPEAEKGGQTGGDIENDSQKLYSRWIENQNTITELYSQLLSQGYPLSAVAYNTLLLQSNLYGLMEFQNQAFNSYREATLEIIYLKEQLKDGGFHEPPLTPVVSKEDEIETKMMDIRKRLCLEIENLQIETETQKQEFIQQIVNPLQVANIHSSFIQLVENQKPLSKEYYDQVKQQVAHIPLLRVAVDKLPGSVVTLGVDSPVSLSKQFEDLHKIKLQSLSQEDKSEFETCTSLIRQFSTNPPDGLVQGNDLSSIISRACYYNSQGIVSATLKELENLQQQEKGRAVSVIFNGWMNKARDYVYVEQLIDIFSLYLKNSIKQLS